MCFYISMVENQYNKNMELKRLEMQAFLSIFNVQLHIIIPIGMSFKLPQLNMAENWYNKNVQCERHDMQCINW